MESLVVKFINKMLLTNKFGIILVFVLGVFNFAILVRAERISPTAWGIAKSKQLKQGPNNAAIDCPEPKCDCNEDLGSIYYKTLVNYLFRKSRPIVDDFDGNHLISIHLQITKEQLQELRRSENVRDIDAIVSSVLESSRGGLVVEAKEVLLSWYDRINYAYLSVINSQTLTLTAMTFLFLVSVLLSRFIFKINLIAVIVVNLLAISLFFEYLDCNRRLEFENIENMKTRTEGPNPCDRFKQYMGLVSNYDPQKCTAYMMSMHGYDRQFCKPIDFVWDFALNMMLKPIGKFLDGMGSFVDGSLAKYGYIKGTIITIIILSCTTYWMRDFLKSFFGLLGSNLSPTQQRRQSIRATARNEESTPSVVNVHINLDPRALGDYVQQVKPDEDKSVGAICMAAPSLPVLSAMEIVENVGDGFDADKPSQTLDESPKGVDDELKKEI